MKSILLTNLSNRTSQFSRNPQLDEMLNELKYLLEPIDEKVGCQFIRPKWPPLFLIGSPRSGTTLLMQLLSATGQFAIPTNLLSRFYYAPYIGAKIQRLLTDKNLDYKNELGDFGKQREFESQLGKTSGILSPSEFFHFWRRFLPNYDPQYLSPTEEDQIDSRGLASGIASIEAVFQKPFAAKAIILQFNLLKLYGIFNNVIFVHVRRNLLYVMQSIYQARKDFYNTLDIWWSVKPKEFTELKHLDIYQQIAGQVYFTERALANGLAQIPDKNQLIVEYEEVCQSPSGFYTKLQDKYKENGYNLPNNVNLPKTFLPSNRVRLPRAEINKLADAYEAFTKTAPQANKI